MRSFNTSAQDFGGGMDRVENVAEDDSRSVTLQLKMILALFASITAVNGDIEPVSNIKYDAIAKLPSAHLLPVEGYGGGSISRTEIVVAVRHAGLDLNPTSRGENVTSSAVIQVGYRL